VIRRRSTTRQRGFALLIVLWTLGLLALLVSAILANSRTQIGIGEATRGSIVAEAAADGAVQRAIFLLIAGAMQPDGMARPVAVGQTRIVLSVVDDKQRINPNFSGPPLLAALLVNAGLDPAAALALARRIVDWRTATPYSISGGQKLDQYRQAGLPYGPPDRPFLSVNEIGQVPGMTPAILSRIRPFLSVYQAGDPQLSAEQGQAAGNGNGDTDSIVQMAKMINHDSVLAGFDSADDVVRITADATAPDGARYVRSAVVRLPREAGNGTPAWTILAWH
jgi:general secretion pathway protein K